MTDQKRDESRDTGVHEDFDQMRPWAEVGDDYRWMRYVPHNDLVAAEARIAELDAKIVELEQEFEFMRKVARKAVKGLDEVTEWREKCHEYDKENSNPLREFGNIEDTWELLESFTSGLVFDLTEEIESI